MLLAQGTLGKGLPAPPGKHQVPREEEALPCRVPHAHRAATTPGGFGVGVGNLGGGAFSTEVLGRLVSRGVVNRKLSSDVQEELGDVWPWVPRGTVPQDHRQEALNTGPEYSQTALFSPSSLFVDGVSLAQTSGSPPTSHRGPEQADPCWGEFVGVRPEERRLCWKCRVRKPPKRDNGARECPLVLTSTL